MNDIKGDSHKNISLNDVINHLADKWFDINNDSWAPKVCPSCGCASYRDLSENRREWNCLSTFENKTWGDKIPYLVRNIYHCKVEK